MIGDFAFNQDVNIPAEDTTHYATIWNGTLYGFGDITMDNIMIIASVFSSDTRYTDETTAASFIETPIVLPDSYTIVAGRLVSGGLEDLFDSDDAYLVVTHSGFWPPWIEVEVQGTAPSSSPSELQFIFEGHTESFPVDQWISMFNYDIMDWEEVDHRYASQSDEVIEIIITDNPSRFIDPGTLEMKTHMKWMGAGFANLYGWNTLIDQTVWIVTS
jgi:hypothetical protein